jgi:hypothetical protein
MHSALLFFPLSYFFIFLTILLLPSCKMHFFSILKTCLHTTVATSLQFFPLLSLTFSICVCHNLLSVNVYLFSFYIFFIIFYLSSPSVPPIEKGMRKSATPPLKTGNTYTTYPTLLSDTLWSPLVPSPSSSVRLPSLCIPSNLKRIWIVFLG